MDDRTVWFNVAGTEGIGPAKFQKIWVILHERSMEPLELVALDADRLSEVLGLSTGLAEALVDRLANPLTPPSAEYPMSMLVAGDEGFPAARLTGAVPPLPPVLWSMGDVALLSAQKTLGVAGSRDASDSAIDAARTIGRGASRAGITVVSGLAAGVDSAAHEGALVGKGGTVGVLASGIARHQGFRPESNEDSICLVSEYPPHIPWDGRRAMQRNATIAALSDRVVIVASGLSGGTWEMAHLCAKRNKDLYVVDFDPQIAPGNRVLLAQLRATAISPDELDDCWLRRPDDTAPTGDKYEGPQTLF